MPGFRKSHAVAATNQWAALLLTPLAVPAALLMLWAVAVRFQWMSAQILPEPSLVLATAKDLLSQDLLDNVRASLSRLALGALPGLVVGWLLGLATGLNRRAEQLLYPTLSIWALVPNLALIPLLMVLLGIGDMLKVAIIFNATLVPMLVHTQSGMRDISPQLREAAFALRLNAWQRLCKLYLPASLPVVLTGLRLALSSAWTALVVVELLASSDGIGYLLVWGRQMFQIDVVFVCIAVIGVLGLALEWLVQFVDRHWVRWPRPALAHHVTRSGPPSAWAWLLPLLLGLLWWRATQRSGVDPHVVPAPGAVWHALSQGFANRSLPEAMAQSLTRYALGLLAGSAAGIALGLACGLRPALGRLLAPTLGALRHIVIFAWLPLLTAWVGTGEGARIVFIGIATFFPLFVATLRGVANLPRALLEAADVLRLTGLQRLRRLVLPGAASAIFAGLRLGLIHGWLATIGSEYFMASSVGIGSLMINAQQLMNVDVIFAGLLLISAAGALLNFTGQQLEQRLQRWRHA